MVPRIPDIDVMSMGQKYREEAAFVKFLASDVKKALFEMTHLKASGLSFVADERRRTRLSG
jgi:hypothetical protein